MPTVRIPPPYRGPTAGAAEIAVEAASLRACIDAIEKRHAGFAAQVFDAAGEVHGFVKLFVNGRRIDAGEIDRPLSPDDEIEILAAIAGG
jgi:molybdopterin converting factor small subunit